MARGLPVKKRKRRSALDVDWGTRDTSGVPCTGPELRIPQVREASVSRSFETAPEPVSVARCSWSVLDATRTPIPDAR